MRALAAGLLAALLLPASAARAADVAQEAPPAGDEAPEPAGPKGKKRPPAELALEASARGALMAGGFSGRSVRRDRGGLATAAADVTLAASWERFRLELPLSLSHEQTVGASLSGTRGSAGAELQWRLGPRLRLSVQGALSGAWRPDWPDLYQPLPDGTYAPTSRYSYVRQEVGGQVAGIPVRHHHARLKYRYLLQDTLNDAAFDPYLAPMHLTPRDGQRHELAASWRYLGKGFKVGGTADAFLREDFFLFARDAGTGHTHTTPGGLPPNPLQSLRGVELAVEGEVELLAGRLTLGGAYGHELVEDTYQGYYSSRAHHPQVKVEAQLGGGLTAVLRGAAWLRDYGPDSYAEGNTHPALTFGPHRVDRRASLGLGLRLQLTPRLSALAEGRWAMRQTNFPSYVPGVFPSTRSYTVDWNYQNLLAQSGLELEL